MKPVISVIIPSFNQGSYIGQTIQSVIDQGYEKTELIIIDGGSKDNTVDVIRTFEQHIAFWVSEPDKGQTDALIKGFKKATGDVLCWINSDDYFMKGAFERVSSFFENRLNEPVVLSGHTRFIEGDGKLVWEPVKNTNETTILSLNESKLLYCWNFSLSQPSTFWNRKTMTLAGYPDEKLKFTMDLEYWLRMYKKGSVFYFTEAVLSCFRYHSESKTMNLKTIQRKELNELAQLYLPTEPDKKRYKRNLDFYFDCQWLLIQSNRLARKNRKEARDLLRQAIKNKPLCLVTRMRTILKILVKLMLKKR